MSFQQIQLLGLCDIPGAKRGKDFFFGVLAEEDLDNNNRARSAKLRVAEILK